MGSQPETRNQYRNDINEECVEVFREPINGVYQKAEKFNRGESLMIQAFDDVKIGVDEIFGN